MESIDAPRRLTIKNRTANPGDAVSMTQPHLRNLEQGYENTNKSEDNNGEIAVIDNGLNSGTEDDERESQAESDQSKVIYLKDLKNKSVTELVAFAESLGIEHIHNLQKQDLIINILHKSAAKDYELFAEGVLEVIQDGGGYGFLRSSQSNYVPGSDDIYVSQNLIRRNNLRCGDTVEGIIKSPKKGERYFAMVKVSKINFSPAVTKKRRLHFDDLTPLFPNVAINLARQKNSSLSLRTIDIVAPLGFGQRCLIVAPPRAGKTVLLQDIAHAISASHPKAVLIVLLIDERPEEVTDMARSVKGEVVSSTFDEPAFRHVQLAEMVIEKAKRLVEEKQDVVILLDSITRLARAYNNVAPSSGKVLSGGVDSNALQKPKRIFGAARNIEEGGSLTIIATALIETGSRMDEVIFEEFKGTGNSEIVLERKLAEKRIFPAIDIVKSGTRKEDLLIPASYLNKLWVLRRILTPMGSADAIEFLFAKMKKSESNEEMFKQMDTYNPSNSS